MSAGVLEVILVMEETVQVMLPAENLLVNDENNK